MSNQTAKFGVLVQRGREQYVIEGREHAVPPSVSPTPSPPDFYCIDGILLGCEEINEGQECIAHFSTVCQRGSRTDPESFLINLKPLPVGEDPLTLELGNWKFEYGFSDYENHYGCPEDFKYLIKAAGDLLYFQPVVNNVVRSFNEEFETNVWENEFQLRFNPCAAGNYTINVAVQFRINSCENCTFTTFVPFPPRNWIIFISCIDRMLEPYKSYDFGSIRIYENKEANFTIKNNINTTLLADIWIDGPNHLDFDIIEGPKGKFYLWPNNHTNIKIRWNPQVLGNQTAKLNISCDNGYWDYCYLLGVSREPYCDCLKIYGDESFGEVLVGQNQTKAYGIKNWCQKDTLVNIKLEGHSDFRIISGGGVQSIPNVYYPGKTVVVEFKPSSPGEKAAYLRVWPCNTSILIKGEGKSAVIFDPWEYDFGPEKIGYHSDTIPFNIKNIGDQSANITISISGEQAKNFELIAGFNGTLYAGSQETVRVRFAPLESGDIKAFLCAEVSASSDEYINITAELKGLGCVRYTTSYIEASPSEIRFPDTLRGCEAGESLTVRSVGCYDAYYKLGIIGDVCFDIQPQNTTLVLKPGQTQTFPVKFSPSSVGNFTAYITLTGLNCNSIQIPVHGTAIDIGDVLKIEPAEHDFGIAVAGWKCSEAKNFTIYNSGSEVLNFTLSLKGSDAEDFVILEGEGDQALPPDSYLNAKVQFCPKSWSVLKEAYLTLEPYSPKTRNISARLHGIAVVPCEFNLIPANYDFGSQTIFTCSEEVNFTLTQVKGSKTSVSVDLIGDTKNFTLISYPKGEFPFHGSANIKVRYCPREEGNHTAFLIITPSICDGLSATLIGKGAAPSGPHFIISPSDFNFGGVREGFCSAIQNFTVRNIGDSPGYISANITGSHAANFTIVSQTGPNKIVPNGWHSFALKFCPDKRGDFYAKLWINTSWEYGETPDIYASLYGGGKFGFDAEFSPPSLDFGEVIKDGCSNERQMYLYNTGSRNMTVRISLGDSKNFTITEGGGYHFLTVNQTHNIKLRFCPKETGNITSYIAAWPEILVDVLPSAVVHGIGGETCSIEISPSEYDFGKIYVGKFSEARTFTIKNNGLRRTTVRLDIDGIDAHNWTIISEKLDSISIGPLESYSFDIQFQPDSIGGKEAYLVVEPDACAFRTALLKGEGIEKVPCPLEVTQSTIDFGAAAVHGSPMNQTIYLKNNNLIRTVVISEIRGDDKDDFDVKFGTHFLSPNASTAVTFQFQPSSPGKKTAWCEIESSNCTVGIIVYLQGQGISPDTGDPSYFSDPPTEVPIKDRWIAIAPKIGEEPPYGFLALHAPNSSYIYWPNAPVHNYYLDFQGCLWCRGYAGDLRIINLGTNEEKTFSIGSGYEAVFALGETSETKSKLEVCYWLYPNFITFAEAKWNGEIWSDIKEITKWTLENTNKVNAIYWYPPHFLLLIEGDPNRVELWNQYDGLVKSVNLDFPPHSATRDTNGRIWISGKDSNMIVSFNSDLEDKDIEVYSEKRKFAGISVCADGDLAVIDRASDEIIVRLAKEGYSKSYTFSLSSVGRYCSAWEGGYCLFTTSNDPFVAVHLRDMVEGSGNRRAIFGSYMENLNLRGDAGLLLHSIWSWKWRPDKTVLNID